MDKDYKIYFSNLFENMGEGAAIHQLVFDENKKPIDYIILKVNTSYEKILNFKKSDVEGKLASEVYNGIFPAFDIYSNVVINKKSTKFIFYFDQMDKYFSVSSSPWNDIGFVSIFFDITDKVKADELIKNNEILYHSLFEKSNYINLLINPKTLNIIDANNKACCFYGYSKKVFKTMKITELNIVHQEVCEETIKKVKNGEEHIFYFKHKIKSGEIKDVECNLNFIKIKGQDLLAITVRDLTELKKSENALKDSEQRLLRAELISKTGNWQLDIKDTIENSIMSASEGAKHIYDLDDLEENYMVYGNVNNFALKEYRNFIKKSLNDLIENNKPYDIEYKIQTPKNKIKFIRSIARYDKKLQKIFGVIRDITEEKQKEEELEKSNTIKSTFLSNISHELRTPMNSIIGFSDILLSNIKNDPKQKDKLRFLRSINSNAKHLGELLTNILDYSRLSSDNFDIIHEKFNINDLFEELNDIFYDVNYKKNLNMVKLDFEMNENFQIITDYLRIKQVLFNVISNSIKFTDHGYIKISHNVIDSYIIFKIEDTGIGIKEDKIKHVFDDFWQEDSTSRKAYSGTGLGLSISKNIVKLLSGDIWLESKFGEGTTFYIKIPIEKKSKISSKKKLLDDIIKNKKFNNKNVLIIDEIPIDYTLLGISLKSLNINVISLKNQNIKPINQINILEEYIKQKDKIDLIIINIDLSKHIIVELCTDIKKINNNCKIIYKSYLEKIDEINRNNGIKYIDYFLSKPLNKEELIFILDKIW